MSLPGWISPRMKECFAKMLEELFLYQSNGVISFSTQGVMIKDDNGQQHFTTTQELNQYPEFLNNFPSDDIITFEVQPSVSSSKIFDCSQFLKDFDESTLYEEIVIPSEPTIKTAEIIELAESVNMIPTTEIIEKQQSKEIIDDRWQKQIEEKIKKVYNKKNNIETELILYFEIGKLLHNRPLKYKKQLQKLKHTIHRNIKRNFCERPYVIANRTFKIFRTVENITNSTIKLTPTDIHRLTHKEVEEYQEQF
jgi:hypothetical protein